MKVKEIPLTSFIKTGSYVFDFITSGGIPRGKIVEFFGKPSSGKTSFALLICKKLLSEGGKVAFFDFERGLTREYLATFGIDKGFTLYLPTSGEECVAEVLKITNQIDLIIIDSVPFLLPEKITDSLGQRARLVTRFLEQFIFANQSSTLLLINQLRSQIGLLGQVSNTEESSNIYALKHNTHLRIKFSHKEYLRQKGEKVGQRISLTVVKSKIGRPQLVGDILYNYITSSLDEIEDILMIAQVFDLIEKVEGDYVDLETGEKIGGTRSVKAWIREHKEELTKKLNSLLEAYVKGGVESVKSS